MSGGEIGPILEDLESRGSAAIEFAIARRLNGSKIEPHITRAAATLSVVELLEIAHDQSKRRELRLHAIHAIRFKGDSKIAAPAILELVGHPDPELRSASLRTALQILDEEDLFVVVSEAAQDPSPSVRLALAESLDSSTPGVDSALIRLLHCGDAIVQAKAMALLSQIGHIYPSRGCCVIVQLSLDGLSADVHLQVASLRLALACE